MASGLQHVHQQVQTLPHVLDVRSGRQFLLELLAVPEQFSDDAVVLGEQSRGCVDVDPRRSRLVVTWSCSRLGSRDVLV